MKFYGVYHIPTQSLFPFLRAGSCYYDFNRPPKRIKHKESPPPRLFESKRLAQRYITEYCKGIRTNGEAQFGAVYTEPLGPPRDPSHFTIVTLNVRMSNV